MAEEKVTKKTTSKKNEEVKVEKRFCTKCGKELKEGEICNCETTSTSNAAVTINSDALLNTAKNSFNTITNVYKKPDTTITEEINKKDSTISIIILISLAISFALYLMSIVSNTVNTAADLSYGLTTIVTNDVSYFKVFIYGILIYALMAVIPMFAAFLIAKITKNNNFTFKRAFKLYTTSNAPLVFGYLGLAIIMVLNISLLNILGLLAGAIISVFCFFNFLLGFNKETTIREDRRSWALTSIIAVWVVIEIIALIIVIGAAGLDTYDKINNPTYNNNYGWNW